MRHVPAPRRLVTPRLATATMVLLLAAHGAHAQTAQAPPTPQQRVAMLKEWLKASQAQLHTYQWIETTVISHDGKEAQTKEAQCYYGVDGTLEKVPVGSDGSEQKHLGILPAVRLANRLKEHEKKEIAEYMKNAEALMHEYIPPDSTRIQNVVDAGGMDIEVVEPGRRVKLDFKDYLKPGDVLGIELDLPTNRLLGMDVASYVDDQKDAVDLTVTMGVLPDGTIYVEETNLSAPSKKVTIDVKNSGYRKAN
jgi:hypothetical protein